MNEDLRSFQSHVDTNNNDIRHEQTIFTGDEGPIVVGYPFGWHTGCTTKSIRFYVVEIKQGRINPHIGLQEDDVELYNELCDVDYFPIAAYTSLPSYCPFLMYEIKVSKKKSNSVYDVIRVVKCYRRFDGGIPLLELQRLLLNGHMRYVVCSKLDQSYKLARSYVDGTTTVGSDSTIVSLIRYMLEKTSTLPRTISNVEELAAWSYNVAVNDDSGCENDEYKSLNLTNVVISCTKDYFITEERMRLMRYFNSSFLWRFNTDELCVIEKSIKEMPYAWCFRSHVSTIISNDIMETNLTNSPPLPTRFEHISFEEPYAIRVKKRLDCWKNSYINTKELSLRNKILQVSREPVFYHAEYPYWSLQMMMYAADDYGTIHTVDPHSVGLSLAMYSICEEERLTNGTTKFCWDRIIEDAKVLWKEANVRESAKYGLRGNWLSVASAMGWKVNLDHFKRPQCRELFVRSMTWTLTKSGEPRIFEYNSTCMEASKMIETIRKHVDYISLMFSQQYDDEYISSLKAIVEHFSSKSVILTSFGWAGSEYISNGTGRSCIPFHILANPAVSNCGLENIIDVGKSAKMKSKLVTLVIDRMHKMTHTTFIDIVEKISRQGCKIRIVGLGDRKDYPGTFGKGSNLFADMWGCKSICGKRVDRAAMTTQGETYSSRMVRFVVNGMIGSLPIVTIAEGNQFEAHYRSVLREAKKKWKKNNFTLQVLATNEEDRIKLLMWIYKVNLGRFDKDVVKLGDSILIAEVGFSGYIKAMSVLDKLGNWVEVKKKEEINTNHNVVLIILESSSGEMATFRNDNTTFVHSEVQLTSSFTGDVSDYVILYMGKKRRSLPNESIVTDIVVAAKHCRYKMSIVVLSELDMSTIYNDSGDRRNISDFSNKLANSNTRNL